VFENEQWRPVNEPQLSHYQVSNYGRVSNPKFPDKVLNLYIKDTGFPVVTLYGADSKSRYLRQINQLVAGAFLEPSPDPKENAVWHLDGDLLNCDLDNLKWERRARVLEWNEMHRNPVPQFKTPVVRNNRTNIEYPNAFECAMTEGRLESDIVWRVERQAMHTEDDRARYRYIYGVSDPHPDDDYQEVE
jgi:hypothetical protein